MCNRYREKTWLTFTNSLDNVKVCLLPQLVALAEVATERILALHYVAGNAQADGWNSGRS